MWYALLACTPSPVDSSAPIDSDTPPDTDTDVDTDARVDTDTDVDADTDPVVQVPDFGLTDVNPRSPRYGQIVSPRDYIGKVAGFYFTHAT